MNKKYQVFFLHSREIDDSLANFAAYMLLKLTVLTSIIQERLLFEKKMQCVFEKKTVENCNLETL